ncbi:MAG: hypothetical protein LKG42_04145 [Eubacterium sp.]|jgi:2-dehydropantoate 2-reductase|nr:hypothetical protein [Eubacterium sp.]MCH4046372.1 hypothetical protein [Eubacterium sp.]MCH4079467.1 hypothetical protein [Eubacterium sp.]MCH4110983.1 hypothetical protein [Eubacterium sp.]MCI1307192.1 hypothetical protein [Eubacterium sp.]
MRKYVIIGAGGTGGALGAYLARAGKDDIVKTNLEILDHVAPDMTTSMQKDIAAGKNSEIKGLIGEVIRMADQYHLDLPIYRKAAAELKSRGRM